MADMPTAPDEMRAHLTADPPAGHGLTDLADMPMAAMSSRHDSMHADGAEHAHPGMRVSDTPTAQFEGELQIRDIAKRELDVRLVTWDTVIDTTLGPEEFRMGAFQGTDPDSVLLMGMEHEAHMGIGQNGQAVLTRRPVGKALSIEERPDAGYATFRVAKTAAGDELLTLADEKIVKGVSIEFREIPGGTRIEQRNGRRTRVHTRVALTGASTTYRPAYRDAAVIAVRSEVEAEPVSEGDTPVSELTPTPDAGIAVQPEAFWEAFQTRSESVNNRILDRLDKMEERYRSEIIVPGGQNVTVAGPKLYEWANVALRMLTGERISQTHIQSRALDDVLVVDNPGVVPDAFVNDVIGIMDPRRPFLSSTERIPTPESGMSIVVPVLTQRSTAAVQSSEKTEIESTAMKVTTQDFPAITIAGGADVSIQLLKRSTPSTLDLLMRDLARAYALNADIQAVATLLNSGVTPGTGNLDPEALLIGEAWSNSIAAIGQAPDTIWLSSSAVANFIDAKNDGTNSPLYASLSTNFNVGNGPGGTLSALRPVYTPALDGSGADVLIGPSTGFAWAEDGTFTLAVDNPTLAGRDIAIVGILFFIPRYPAAFTSYNISS